MYVFLLSGNITVDGQELNTRDGFGVWAVDKVQIRANQRSEMLLMEVPMMG
ncbi:MAG: hypothetical protein ACKOCH_26010 [Bacteroidota bacterium]